MSIWGRVVASLGPRGRVRRALRLRCRPGPRRIGAACATSAPNEWSKPEWRGGQQSRHPRGTRAQRNRSSVEHRFAPVLETWRIQSGAAVTRSCRGRWTFLEGSSRRHLRPLLADLGSIDIFIHDSLHSAANNALRDVNRVAVRAPGRVLLADDIESNPAFARSRGRCHPLRRLLLVRTRSKRDCSEWWSRSEARKKPPGVPRGLPSCYAGTF
jgi:hypothetical protein